MASGARDDCLLCRGKNIRPIYTTRDRHYGIEGLFTLVRCTGCGLICLDHIYSDAELTAMYPADYYAYQIPAVPSKLERVARKLLGYEARTKDPDFAEPGKLLDIGCGSGSFLLKMKAQGWEVAGIEPNRAAAALAREQGLNVFCGPLDQAGFGDASFDYIRANHAFEHMTKPREALEEISRLLRRQGRLFLGVPNCEGLTAKIFGEFWWHLCPPIHPFSYSMSTLCRLLEEHRFRIIERSFNSDYAGILGSLQAWANRRNGRRAEEGRLISNRIFRIWFNWLAKILDLFRKGDVIEVIAAPIARNGNSG